MHYLTSIGIHISLKKISNTTYFEFVELLENINWKIKLSRKIRLFTLLYTRDWSIRYLRAYDARGWRILHSRHEYQIKNIKKDNPVTEIKKKSFRSTTSKNTLAWKLLYTFYITKYIRKISKIFVNKNVKIFILAKL